MTWQDPGGPGGAEGDAPTPPPQPTYPPGPPPPPASTPPGWVPPPAIWAPPPGSALYGAPGAPGMRFGSVLGRFLAYWLDGILVGIVAGLIVAIVPALVGRGGTATLVSLVILVGINLMYFVGFWTGGSRATPGMRLMKLQVGNAGNGSPLTTGQGLIRWLALYGIIQAVSFLPTALAAYSGLAAVEVLAGLWLIALLVSTLVSPTRQGIHDRLARSLMVQPEGASTPAMACLILLVLFLVLPLVAIVALIFLGGQVSTILSNVGSSI